VNGLGAGGAGGVEDLVDAQVAVLGGRGADGDGLVGHAHVDGVAVGVRVDGDDGDVALAAGAGDPAGDLAAVGDEDLLQAAGGHR